MTDIAELGLRVDTSQLEQATKKLDALKSAAAGVSQGATKMAAAVEGANSAVLSAATMSARAEAQRASAMVKNLQLTGKATKEEITAARALEKRAKAALATAQADETRARAAAKAALADRKAEMATRAAAASMASSRPGNVVSGVVSGGTLAPARDQMPNRFNTGNIAAQFQDIGVTAAMGMNPMMIALQQGTQLSAIINSMANPLQGIAIAFKSILNVTSLLSIGLVGLVAAFLQMVNWTKVAQAVLNGLADVIEVTLPYIMGFGVALSLMYSRTIISGLVSVGTTILSVGGAALKAGYQMAAAWVIGMGPIGWIAAGIAGLVVALNLFQEDLKKLLGFDVLEAIKVGINKVIGFFLGMFEGIWRMAQELIARLKGEGTMSLGDAFAKGMGDALERDYIGKFTNAAKDLAGAAAKGLRGAATGIGQEDGDKKKDPWEELVKSSERKIATMKAEAAAIGLTEIAAAKLKYQTEMLNEAQQKNINLTPAMRQKIDELAQGMANAEIETKRLKDAYDFMKDAAKGFFSDIKQGLQEGKGLWQSFGDAVVNVLNKILDKLLDVGIDQVFGGGSLGGGAGGTDGWGGLLSSAGSWLSGLFGSAKGNGFDRAGMIPFKSGGAFTNSIVSKPTPFTFASGGALGEMGEAGPEAIMPLHRGPDGSLGVKVSGGAANDNGGGVTVNVINNGNGQASVNKRQTSNGVEIDVVIDEVMGQKMSEPGTASNRALQSFNQRSLIAR